MKMNETKKIIAICGKICSGKSYYAISLRSEHGGVILSTDELTWALTRNKQGESYNELARNANEYLMKKACEIVRAGSDVILDWGFWSRKDREHTAAFCKNAGVDIEWHYLDMDYETRMRNIARRNEIVLRKGGPDFFVDEGLLQKMESLWQTPEPDEIDVWVKPETRITPRE